MQLTTTSYSITKGKDQGEKKVLFLCKVIKVVHPKLPGIREQALTLFDIGSRLSIFSKDLANRLNLQDTEEEELHIASFDNKMSKPCLKTKAEIGGRMEERKF